MYYLIRETLVTCAAADIAAADAPYVAVLTQESTTPLFSPAMPPEPRVPPPPLAPTEPLVRQY